MLEPLSLTDDQNVLEMDRLFMRRRCNRRIHRGLILCSTDSCEKDKQNGQRRQASMSQQVISLEDPGYNPIRAFLRFPTIQRCLKLTQLAVLNSFEFSPDRVVL